MPNVQWTDIPWQLQSFRGNLNLNPILTGTLGPQWILQGDKCQIGAGKRVTRDNIPQRGGEIMHRHFKTGLVLQLGMLAVNVVGPQEIAPACGSDLVDLFDNLMLILNAMENTDGRVQWTPSGKTARMMDACRWLGGDGSGGGGFVSAQTAIENEVFTSVEFAMLSPFPYAMDAPQTTTALANGVLTNVTNTGNADFSPVIRVNGAAAGFTILNSASGQSLVYNPLLPGASSIAAGRAIEFDFFRETGYFGPIGGPYTSTTAKPGIDVQQSDFWTLAPGVNGITLTGASGTMLWQPAYTG